MLWKVVEEIDAAKDHIDSASAVAHKLGVQVDPDLVWFYPVGSFKFPTVHWYAASWHDLTGRKNAAGYKHTGIDLNGDKAPWGDVDRGEVCYAITKGIVHVVHYSVAYLGSVVLKIRYYNTDFWLRYWHLADDSLFRSIREGMEIPAGAPIGHMGNYTLGAGGDHFHIDLATSPIGPHWWWSSHPEVTWIDPLFLMRAHLDPDVVDLMVKKGVPWDEE